MLLRRSLRLGAAIHFSVCDAIESDFIESAALKSMQNTLKISLWGLFLFPAQNNSVISDD